MNEEIHPPIHQPVKDRYWPEKGGVVGQAGGLEGGVMIGSNHFFIENDGMCQLHAYILF